MLFSIVSVCFNNPEELLQTLNSIESQNFDDCEVIIVNGGEKALIDKVVASFGNLNLVYISEPDQGIYDAMNKGAAKANGDYIIYLNSGDKFYDEHTLTKVKHSITPDVKIIYGSSVSDYGYKKVLCKAKSKSFFLSKKFYSLGFSHQSIFVQRGVLSSQPFDLKYKVAADFNYLYPKLRKLNTNLLRLNFPVSIFATGGISDLDKSILNREKKEIYFSHNTWNFLASLYFNKLILLEKIKRLLRPIIRRWKL